MDFSKLLHGFVKLINKFLQIVEFVKVVLGTERLHRILNYTYSESLWRWLFKSESGTQIQRQGQWQGGTMTTTMTNTNNSYPGHAQSHLVRFLDVQVYLINEQSVSCFSFEFFLPDCSSYIAHHQCWSDKWTNNGEEWKSECKSVTRQEWKKDSIFGRKLSHWN